MTDTTLRSRNATFTASKQQREARPDEVNYALKQNMGEGFRRGSVKISALGAEFDMVYGEWIVPGKSSKESPAVICIHGTPATDGAFRPIASRISAQGYRVLSVNFPGMGYTKVDPGRKYGFSVPHKAELVKSFIFELKLKKVAMMIGHSLGCQVVGRLAVDQELEGIVESAGFLSGTGVVPHKLYKRFTSLQMIPHQAYMMYRALYIPVFGWLFMHILAFIVFRLGFRGKTKESQALCYYEVSIADFSAFGEDLTRLAERELPVLLVYSQDDDVVESELIDQNIQILGIPENSIKDYDKDGQSEHTFQDDTLKRAVCFAAAKHRPHYVWPQEVVQEMSSFLTAVCSRHKSQD